jgi:hypothetical protein
VQTAVSPSFDMQASNFVGAVSGGLTQSLDGSPSFSQALSSSNISASGDPVSNRHLLSQDLDEAIDSGNFGVASDAPTAPVPGGNTAQIYIGEHNLRR